MRSARQRASEVAKPDQFDQRQMIVDSGFLMGREDDEDESLPAPLGTRGNGRRAWIKMAVAVSYLFSSKWGAHWRARVLRFAISAGVAKARLGMK